MHPYVFYTAMYVLYWEYQYQNFTPTSTYDILYMCLLAYLRDQCNPWDTTDWVLFTLIDSQTLDVMWDNN